jgi:hypothetical protein
MANGGVCKNLQGAQPATAGYDVQRKTAFHGVWSLLMDHKEDIYRRLGRIFVLSAKLWN